eukprot:gene33611-45009_t
MLPLNRNRTDKLRQLTVSQMEERFAARFPALTRRERQVCARAAIGMTVEATALDLAIGKTSVLTYRQRAYGRLNVTSPFQLSRRPVAARCATRTDLSSGRRTDGLEGAFYLSSQHRKEKGRIAMKSYIMGASVLALAAASATPALAQDAATPAAAAQSEDGQTGLKDIVVTAQRRSESVQKAALSIVAISGDDLRARGVNNIDALARQTAGIEIQPSGGPYTTFTVRSVSNLSGNAFSDPSIAVNVNGVYLATPTTFRGLFFDLDRVELLKGPQGTLYGRNATGGAINILPAKPTFKAGGYVGADLGNYDHFDINAAVNLPFSDNVAFRMAGQRAKHSGYMSLGTNDEDVTALRASLLFKPSEDLSILLSADWAHEGGKGPGATLRKSCAALGRSGTSCFVADPYTDVGDLPSYYTSAGIAVQSRNPYLDSDYYGVGLNVDWRTASGTVGSSESGVSRMPRRQQQHGAQQCEQSFERDADQAERQRDQPEQRVQNQCQQCERPAQHEQQQPEQELDHRIKASCSGKLQAATSATLGSRIWALAVSRAAATSARR